MTTYTVKYKKPEWVFWRTLKGIKGDGILYQQHGDITRPVPVRYFILSDDSRIEIPMTLMFKFDSYRCRKIEEDIRKEAGR